MLESFFALVNRHKRKFGFGLIAVFILNFLVFSEIFARGSESGNLEIYFFDVGQGDSQFVILPGGVKVLIDGGAPNGKTLQNLADVLGPTSRYIDLVMLSHPEYDHFGGLIDVLKRYQVGAVILNGRAGTAKAWGEFEKALGEYSIKNVILSKGDKISYEESRFDILSPTKSLLGHKNANESSLVALLKSAESKTIFTGDIGFEVEKLLLVEDIDADILKVGHHGSKYSSDADFLARVSPRIAVIGVGKNSYGHPTKEALGRLEAAGAKIYRTDKNGTIKLAIDGKRIQIFKQK